MHGIFDIVLQTLGPVIALALVGGGLYLAMRRSFEPAKILLKLLFTLPFVAGCLWSAHKSGAYAPLYLAVMGIILSILWTPHIGEWLASPLSGMFDGGHEPPERKPYYSVAMTRRNRGKPREAVVEIRRQLASFPHDFEGFMLLARVLAEDLSDLPGAENTLNQFCDWPEAPSRQVAAAYTQLADWYLKLAADAESARSALQKIIARFPNTETALQAQQRIAHLSDAEKMIREQQDRSPVELPPGVQNIGLLDSTDFMQPPEVEPGRIAAAHVKHLEAHPHDTEVREKLALVYARDFQRLDLATLELEQLINEPRHQPKQIAHWLNLLANLQLDLGADQATVQCTLGKIVERFPDLPVAELARRRLDRLENELKGLKPATTVKLGTYEQNIGLKYGAPPKR